jgi:predicted phage terminase large subunit-like protein
VPDIDPETGESNFDYDFNGMSAQFFHDQEMVMDDISYRCLYKNEPIEREGLLYHEDDIKRYLNLPMQPPDAVLSIADTKNKGIDYFAQPVLYQYGDDYYMVDCICSNESDYEIQYVRSVDLIVRNKVEACHFESNNGGDRVSFEVDKRLKAKGYYCNITQEYTTANKETKIIVYAPWVKQHVYFKDKSQYTVKSDYGVFMSQLLSYSVASSNRGQHDDCCDVMASFAKRQGAPKPEQARVIRSPI